MKKVLIPFIVICAVGLLGSLITDKTYLLKALRVTYLRGNIDGTIDDYEVQATQKIKAKNPVPWQLHEKYNQVELSTEILKTHTDLKSIAFLVIKDGKILTEQYFNEGSKEHLSSVWSISKTYTSLLILKAIEDGLISDINDPVTKYIPELKFEQEDTLTLRHLASMSAGLYWDESSHTPFSLITKLNFYSDLEKFTLNDMRATGEPGQVQHYNSGATQILGTVLDRVLKEKSISDYLSEKVWSSLGCEYDGLYILDSKKHGNEKTFGGIVATARDVSRLGQLLLQNGYWNGKQILSEDQMALFTTLPYNNSTYNYGIWTGDYKGHKFYYQLGFLGQFCITVPDLNLVITRLGHEISPTENLGEEDVEPDTYLYIEEAIRIIEESEINPIKN